MCDYSLHAVASRPAQVGETIVSTTFRGTSTRGFASESDMSVAVCLLPGTELVFAKDVRYDSRWGWARKIRQRLAKFGKIDPHVHDRHHDAVEFPDGKYVLVTQLVEGQRATVIQLPAKATPPKLPIDTVVQLPEETQVHAGGSRRIAPVTQVHPDGDGGTLLSGVTRPVEREPHRT